MFPLDFEEFLYANGMNNLVVSSMRQKFERSEPLDETMHNKMMDLFRKYLLVGGLPDAVKAYIETKNKIYNGSVKSKMKSTTTT